MKKNNYNITTVEGKMVLASGSMTILDSAINSGLVFEYGCKTGRCGVCKTRLLSGEVEEMASQLSLTEEDKSQGKILTCCCKPVSDVLIDAEDLSVLHGISVQTLPVRIKEIEYKSSDIVEVVFRFPPAAKFEFLEGQYIDVVGSRGIRRSYSIASSARDKEIKLLIKKVDGGQMSQYWFEDAKVNDLLRIEGPKGTFFLRDYSKPMIFLATGTGIAPILSMLTFLDENSEYLQENELAIFWGNRYESDFVWEPMFESLKVRFFPVVSKPTDQWLGDVGYVQEIASKVIPDVTNYHVYACGSNDMIQASRECFIEKGLEDKFFFSDAFVQSF